MTNSLTRPVLSKQEGTESPSLFRMQSWVNHIIPNQENQFIF